MPQIIKLLPRALMLATLATIGTLTLTACEDQKQKQEQGKQAPGGGGGTQGGKQ